VTKEESIRFKGIILLKMSSSKGEFLFKIRQVLQLIFKEDNCLFFG
jgi:hypothetical protein